MEYIYHGDKFAKFTHSRYLKQPCKAVRTDLDKCIRKYARSIFRWLKSRYFGSDVTKNQKVSLRNIRLHTATNGARNSKKLSL